jgi:hypothetical protein
MQQTSMHERLATVRERTSRPIATPPSILSFDERVIALLLAPLMPGETARNGFDRKEREVGALFAQLPPADALKLSLRLRNASLPDPLITALQRLTADRRLRLIAFLADARRRAAMAGR